MSATVQAALFRTGIGRGLMQVGVPTRAIAFYDALSDRTDVLRVFLDVFGESYEGSTRPPPEGCRHTSYYPAAHGRTRGDFISVR